MEESDKRAFVVPCPKCNAEQVLVFHRIRWPDGAPAEAYYECEVCRAALSDADRFWAIRRGTWRATCEAKRPGTAGFHLPEWYSTWKTMAEMVMDFLEAKRGGVETLKVWKNTAAAETWEEEGESLSAETLTAKSRREEYQGVPHGVGILIAAVDVQDDRLEGHVVGFGAGEESWIVDFHQVFGDPGKQTTWDGLDEWLDSEWEHESGQRVRLSAALIDIGGHHTDEVYKFCVGRQGRKIRPCQGQAQRGKEICGRPSRKNRYKVPLYPIGTDTAKDTIFSRLKITTPGPGYIHFPKWLDDEYIAQLTAEKAVRRYKKGKGSVREYVKVRTRNEALDLTVYALAGLYSLGLGIVRSLGRRAAELSVPVEQPKEPQAKAAQEAEAPRPRPVRFRFQ
jgi:phage terminase large subunit GpA-like protein